MVVLSKFATGAAISASLFGTAIAHPGEKHDHEQIKREIALRNTVAAQNRRSLEACAGSASDVALKQRAIMRRESKVRTLRAKRGLVVDRPLIPRAQEDLESYATLSHESAEEFTIDTDPSVIFAQNATCVVVPETTIGPYWVAGELIRTDITDGQAGVPVHLDIQFVDVNTCTGVPDLLVDMWHCNATGVYSGVTAAGQGGLDSTFARGVQESNSDGVTEFDSIYPGHYTGRTNHIHIKSTADAEILSNGTYTLDSGITNHIGQLFFDQDLTTLVEATTAYNTNTQELTTNLEDSIAAGSATEEYDPFMDYVMLGDSIEDGLLMWITVGIDTSADYQDQVSAAAVLQEDGGVDTSSDNGFGGGPDGAGGAPGNGTAPPGFSGSAPVPSATDDAAVTETETATETEDASSEATTAVSTFVPVSGAARKSPFHGLFGGFARHH